MWVLRAVTEVGLQRREEDSAYRLRRQGRLSGRSNGRTGEYLAQGEAKYDVVTGVGCGVLNALLFATYTSKRRSPGRHQPQRYPRQRTVASQAHNRANNADIESRESILKLHLAPIKLDPGTRIEEFGGLTPGFSGAELTNLCNEVATMAARKDKSFVEKTTSTTLPSE